MAHIQINRQYFESYFKYNKKTKGQYGQEIRANMITISEQIGDFSKRYLRETRGSRTQKYNK